MKDEARAAAASAASGGSYEFRIAGTVGPLTRAALPGLVTVVIPRFTVLTGTCGGPDELARLLTVLAAHGSPAAKARITPGGTP